MTAEHSVGAMRHREDLDHEVLAECLEALANANRLRILGRLVEPKAVRDLRVAPESVKEGENPERPMSRQAVREHLLRLAQVGVVRRLAEDDGGGRPWREEFVLNQARMFAIAEEFRKLCRLRPVVEGDDATAPATPFEGPGGPAGPRLVIVHGLNEGRSFPLDGPGPWVLGRRRDLHVPLEYDAFVSSENAVIARGSPGLLLADVPSSRNGTYCNWHRLLEGELRRLEHGDVVGVGRSMLMYRDR